MIIGHQKIRSHLKERVINQRFPQTVLFYGLAGSGKKQVALEVAESLLVHDENTRVLFATGQHPDLFVVAPQLSKSQNSKKTNSEGSIRTEQISDLKKSLGFSPLLSEKQVVIIDSAELMTKATANSLLKILEEPKPHQIFILITKALHDLLITIRSRATKFYFAPLSQSDVLEVLKTQASDWGPEDKKQFDFFSRIFSGSPSQILKAMQMNLSQSELHEMIQKRTSLIEIRRRVEKVIASEMDLDLFLHILRGVALDEILHHQNPQALHFLDKIDKAEVQSAKHISTEFVLENLFL